MNAISLIYSKKMKLPMIKLPRLFLLTLYNAKETCVSLDNLRFSLYRPMQMMKKTKKRKSSSIASFKFESLPPTTAAAKYHAYRAYFAIF